MQNSLEADANAAGSSIAAKAFRAPELLRLPSDKVAATAGEIPSLDGLRSVSILLVLFAHLVNDKLFPGGLGVLIFFVISGFLITRLMFTEIKRTGTLHLSNFYKRRMYRLYPAIVAFTVAVCVVYLVRDPARLAAGWIEPISSLGYFANYAFAWKSVHHAPVLMPFQIFWSLAIEFQFYLMLPAGILLFRGNPLRIFWLATGACLLPLAIRVMVASLRPELVQTFFFYFHTETRIDSIATGVMIAAACELPRGRAAVTYIASSLPFALAAGATAFACLAIFREPFFRETLRYTLLNLSAAVLLSAVVFSDRYRWLNLALNSLPFLWIGEVSYSLYVWHEGTADAVRFFLPWLWHPVQIVVIFAGCFAVAAASFYAIEKPFQALRKRLLVQSQTAR